MKQILLNRLESILVAVGGAVPAPLVPSNFYARSLQLAELILVAIGGTVPPAAIPTNYKQRLLTLLELSLTAEGQTPIPLTPIANFRDRLLTLLGQLLVFGGGSVPALATPTNFEQRLLLLMDGLVIAAPNFVGPTFQAETTAYENRVIALGSTLPAGAKTAIDAFFVAIKSQAYYSKIKLLWLGAGPASLAGLGAHLIHSSPGTAATLTAFVAGDYNRNGSSLGLRGGGSRIVNHQFPPNLLTSGNASIFVHTTTVGNETAGQFAMGPLDASTQTLIMANFNNVEGYAFFPMSSNAAVIPVSAYGGNPAFIIGVRDGNRTGSYVNGTFQAWAALLAGSLPSTGSAYTLYAPAYGPTTRRVALSGCGDLFTALEASHFSTRVATLISALAAVA